MIWEWSETTFWSVVVVLFLLGLYFQIFGEPKPHPPPPKATVTFDERGVTVAGPDPVSRTAAWEEIAKVCIVTTDAGPFVDDLFWVLLCDDGGELVIPSESIGYQDFVQEFLRRFVGPGHFDPDAYFAAFASCWNAEFVVWERAPASPPPITT